jgi:hypothetical protein
VRQYKDACDRGLSRSIGDYWKNRKASNREGGESSAEDGGQDFTEVVGGEIVAQLEVGREVVALDGNLANEPELEGGGAEDRVAAGDGGAVEQENVTNEPEREGGAEDLVDAGVGHEDVTNEPERAGGCGDAEGFGAVEHERVTNEPERARGGIGDCGDAGVESEHVTNEPERKGGGAGATETVSDSLNEMGEGFLGAIDAGISAFRRDLATPGEIAEAIDLRGPPVTIANGATQRARLATVEGAIMARGPLMRPIC